MNTFYNHLYNLKKFGLLLAAQLLFTTVVFGQGWAGLQQTTTVKVTGITTTAQFAALTADQKNTTSQYTDGLGRVIQSIAMQASPLHKDIIQPVVYNTLGQQVLSRLPYLDGDSTGNFRTTVNTAQPAFYNNGSVDKVADDTAPFSQRVFDNSPLSRLLKSGMAGAGFQPLGSGTQHYTNMSYRANLGTADGNIIIWGPDGSNQGNYADNLLAVTDGQNEDNMETLTFTNLQGQVILKRQKNGALNQDTYYIYNNAGMISYVVPPAALAIMVSNSSYDPNQTVVNKLVFKYVYDERGRLVEKTIPGAGVMYIVYDPLDRPVLMQDARLRTANQWNYIKYNVKDQPISQGIYTDAINAGRAAMQTYVTTGTIATAYASNWYESRNTTAATGYYSNNAFPTTGITPLGYSYYDDYDIDGNGTANYAYATQSLTGESTPTSAPLQGVPTMVSLRTTGNGLSNIWLLKVLFYDKNGRVIQTQSNNQLNYTAGAITDYSTAAIDFTGKPTQTKVVKVTGTASVPVTASVITTLSYDRAGRITAADQSYNGGAVIHIGAYHYNELGQLVEKNLQPGNGGITPDITLTDANNVSSGSTSNVVAGNSITLSPNFVAASGSAFSATINPGVLQSVDYRYNIRGQLTSINNSKLSNDSGTTNTNDDSNDLFGMQLLYEQTDANLGNAPSFAGNVSAVKWMSKDASGTSTNERALNYSYDALNRYTGGAYAERAVAGTGSFSLNVNAYNESGIIYNASGNILSLQRNASNVNIDNLTYTYDPANPNQLQKVTDGTGSNYTCYGFANLSGTTTGTYTYDENGNLTGDPYKSLTIGYNPLNRTDKITITSATGRYVYYTYDGTGQLIKKQQYDNNALQSTTDYLDGFVYINNVLSYFPMPEGRVRNTGSGSTVTLKPEYIMTDQQGNARISLEESAASPGVAVVRQENSYYGFGLVMPGSPVATPSLPNNKLYNGGSEWQNDYGNLPDYYQTYYRNYDAALGRFIGVDPEAESTESLTSYQYAGNNPIMYNDPLGNVIVPGANRTTWPQDPGNSNPGGWGAALGDYGGYGRYYARLDEQLADMLLTPDEREAKRKAKIISEEGTVVYQAGSNNNIITKEQAAGIIAFYHPYGGNAIGFEEYVDPQGRFHGVTTYAGDWSFALTNGLFDQAANQGGNGNQIAVFDLLDHYEHGNGTDYRLSKSGFDTFINDMKAAGKINKNQGVPVPNVKGLYQVTVNTHGTDYYNAVGLATIYYNSTGYVGYSDWWNFDSKPWGTRSFLGELATRYGSTLTGQPFMVIYGITPPENTIPKH